MNPSFPGAPGLFFHVAVCGLFFLFDLTGANAQMISGQDTLYGNEWIDYDLNYYKIPVAEDGIYQVSYEALAAAGIPVDQITGAQWRMFRFGQEVPLQVADAGLWAPGDSFTFYAEKNRVALDRHMFAGGVESMLNPEYSIITDTAVYFLTWTTDGSSSLRFTAVSNNQSNPPAAEPWFLSTQIQSLTSRHTMYSADGVAESVFTSGEGFAGNLLSSQTLTLDLPGLVAVQTPVQLDIRLVSNNTEHDLRVTWNGEDAYQENYNGYELRQLSLSKPATDVPQLQSVIIAGQASSSDRYSVAVLKGTYPRSFAVGNVASLRFKLPDGPGDRPLVFTGMAAGEYGLYVPGTAHYMTATAIGDTVRFQLPEAMVSGEMQLVRIGQGIKQVMVMEPAVMSPLLQQKASYLILSHPALFDDGTGHNQVQEYADYRASTAGGGFTTAIIRITDLYDQFSYGIPRHPLAIRNFIHQLEVQGKKPDFLFIVGKGRQYHLTRTKTQLAHNDNRTFFVPTWGAPGSDNLLVTHPFTNHPTAAIGRLAAESGDEVRMYLEKIRQHEAGLRSPAYEDRLWRKEVVHLGGGASTGEQQTIHSALDQMEDNLREGSIGANVTSFYKTSSDPIQYSVSQELTRRINEGSGLITFFGHSGAGGLDFSIDEPRNFTNKGRYPVILSLGCYSGQIHEGFKSIGENFVFQEEKAALAFFATTGLGYVSSLRSLGVEYTSLIGGDAYGQSIGEIMQQSLMHFNANSGFGLRVLLQQFTLLGDPAIQVFTSAGPDYWVRPQTVSVGPAGLSASDDSLFVQVPVINTGRNTGDTLTVRLEHILPDGSSSSISDYHLIADRYQQELAVSLPLNGERSGGENRILITLDPDQVLAEFPLPEARENNVYMDADGKPGQPFTVLSNAAYPGWPMDFGIVGKAPVELRAYTANTFAPVLDYVMQMDTSPLFNSPLFRTIAIQQSGGVLHWTPDIPWIDSTVYFWRISPDSDPMFWRQRSFVYIQGSASGWHQSHVAQLKENVFDNLTIDSLTEKLRYAYDVRTVRIKNAVYPKFPIGVDFDNDPHYFIIWDGPVNRGIYVFAVDPVTAKPWINLYPGFYGSHQPTPWAVLHGHFPYWTHTPEWREKAINFIKDTIPSGYYVIVYTIQYENTSYMPEAWAADSINLGTNLFQVLEEQGAQSIRSTATDGPHPYILMYKKDDPTWPVQERLGALDEPMDETVLLNGLWDQGGMISQQIGPASQWKSITLKLNEIEADDEWQIALWGRRADGTRALILPEITAEETSLSFVDAGEYPFIDLEYFSTDLEKRSPVQLDFWRVLFDGLPDLVLNPSDNFQWTGDTILQGQAMAINLGVANIQDVAADSVLVRFVLSGQGGPNQIFDKVYPPMNGPDSMRIEWTWNNTQRTGSQLIQIVVNPGPKIAETEYRNNSGSLPFFIVADEKSPVLLVTFDGVQISRNALVSSRPTIRISLTDEQPFLRLKDTSVISLWLQGPDGGASEPIYYTNADNTFYPASSSGPNRAEVIFLPQLASGEYVLRVAGKDGAGNGQALNYEVQFQVEEESGMTHFWVSPNPVSSYTRFHYRLTGNDPIANYAITLYDMRGRIARVLNQSDLGPLQVGEHQTPVWYPETLPSGAYYYEINFPEHPDWRKPVLGSPQSNSNARPILIIH